MTNRITKLLPKLALTIGCLSFCGDLNAGIIVFDVIDNYDLIRPDATLGDPLDKGFSVSGTITVSSSSTGFFGEGNVPFVNWNITEQVDEDGDLIPDRTNTFTEANSVWNSRQSGNVGFLPVLEITESYIFLKDLFNLIGPDGPDNTLTLDSTSLGQGLEWFRPGGGEFLFVSGVPGSLDPNDINGFYEGGGGDVRVAVRRSAPVPEPSACIVWSLLGVCGGALRRRRKA